MSLFIAVMVVVAQPVEAPATAPADSTKQATVKDRKICQIQAITGSRLSNRRVCLTKDEWDYRHQIMAKDLEEAARRQHVGMGYERPD